MVIYFEFSFIQGLRILSMFANLHVLVKYNTGYLGPSLPLYLADSYIPFIYTVIQDFSSSGMYSASFSSLKGRNCTLYIVAPAAFIPEKK